MAEEKRITIEEELRHKIENEIETAIIDINTVSNNINELETKYNKILKEYKNTQLMLVGSLKTLFTVYDNISKTYNFKKKEFKPINNIEI